MELFETIYTRRAIRKFTQNTVDRNTLLALIDAAVHAPSALDLQPWTFFVVQNREALARISGTAKSWLLEAGSPLPQELKHALSDPAFDILYGAPILVVICADMSLAAQSAVEDCCLAAENLMLGAHAKALGTCWIGLATPWLNTPAAKAELGIPDSWKPIAPIVLGEPAHLPPPPRRKQPRIFWHGSR